MPWKRHLPRLINYSIISADDVHQTTSIRRIASNVGPSFVKIAIEEFEGPERRLHRRPRGDPPSRLRTARSRGTVSCCRCLSSGRRSHRQSAVPSGARGCAGRRQRECWLYLGHIAEKPISILCSNQPEGIVFDEIHEAIHPRMFSDFLLEFSDSERWYTI
jgi:hypothetical protein